MPSIKAVYRYIDESSKSKFNQSQCLLTISVGQEVHENEKFETTIELVNNSFDSCIMLIDDTLQRHTMVLDRTESPNDVYQIALDEGDRWLERNKKYFSNLSNLANIIRWDKWLNHSNYLINQKLIKDEIENDSAFKFIFDDTIQEFLKRYYSRLLNKTNFDLERGYTLCFDYLIEECTAMTLWPELGCHFEVYPSRRNFAMDETHKRFVLPKWPDLLHAVAVKFKNRKQLKPQQFPLLSETQHSTVEA
ncbi:hypothetical protein [Legionella maceachernii]|uniref:Cyclodipeptide synthase n=1 Tax=Legionella maceachernii TaxID=466 RepID=A0A0W0WBR4_9GAMM|nr:hypothetical protein [Legionella maceachernii]KTD29683.1 hypothetical protein Lmac_0858 [Legionella maceachernii]SKA21090.1 Cyclodipeptide synthase [Legionella maceachernii]SUP02580.1 Uncharacterised protein [Legionella maceachernii]